MEFDARRTNKLYEQHKDLVFKTGQTLSVSLVKPLNGKATEKAEPYELPYYLRVVSWAPAIPDHLQRTICKGLLLCKLNPDLLPTADI